MARMLGRHVLRYEGITDQTERVIARVSLPKLWFHAITSSVHIPTVWNFEFFAAHTLPFSDGGLIFPWEQRRKNPPASRLKMSPEFFFDDSSLTFYDAEGGSPNFFATKFEDFLMDEL